MATVRSFAPVARPDAKILILGSMPGKVSLLAQQYYAHPHNLFWPIMGTLFGAKPDLPYSSRLEILQSKGVALWDVMQECYRESALDSDIVEATIIANNFGNFFANHLDIQRVYFNGTKAEQAFNKYVAPGINTESIRLIRLPSTSPANATLPNEIKLRDWRQITD